MANKKNPECVNKDIMLRVRVTAAEREKFTVMAKEKGFKSVSKYIRSLVAYEEEIPKKRRSKKKALDNIA
jgi:hypothetical protein